MKKSKHIIITLLLTLGLSISAQNLLAAWVAPSADPPTQNISLPVHTGDALQTKQGPLEVNNAGVAANGLTVLNGNLVSANGNIQASGFIQAGSGDSYIGGNLGIGVASPLARLDIGGDAKITGEFAMDGALKLREYASSPATEAGYSKLYALEDVMTGPDSFTKLLIHSDSTDGDTSFSDASASGHSVSPSGDVHHETTNAKPGFGATSIQFDGSGDYLTVPDSDDWDFGSEDFTIDFWMNASDEAANRRVLSQFEDATNYFQIFGDNGALRVYGLDQNVVYVSLTASGYAPQDTWQHVAVVRESDSWSLYVNGSLIDNYTNANDFPDLSASLRLGEMNGAYYSGYIDEIRISKGIARWTSDFSADLPLVPYGQDTEPGLVFKNSNGTEIVVGSGSAGGGGSAAASSIVEYEYINCANGDTCDQDPDSLTIDAYCSAGYSLVSCDFTANGNGTFLEVVSTTLYQDHCVKYLECGNPNECAANPSLSLVCSRNTSGVPEGDGVPAGSVVAFNQASCPTGWNPANGQNGTPDLRGMFIRGMESFENGANASTSDPDRSGGASDLGTYQDDELGSHDHVSFVYTRLLGGGGVGYHIDGGSTEYNTSFTGGAETRPKNVALIYCVKASGSSSADDSLFTLVGSTVGLNNSNNLHVYGDFDVYGNFNCSSCVGSLNIVDDSIGQDDLSADSVDASELVAAYEDGSAYDSRFVNENSIPNCIGENKALQYDNGWICADVTGSGGGGGSSCVPEPLAWGNCSASSNARIDGFTEDLEDLVDDGSGWAGSASFYCDSGTWVLQTGWTCTATCNATTLSWYPPYNRCQAGVGAALSGNSVNLSDPEDYFSDHFGSATFHCNSGSWALQPGSTCIVNDVSVCFVEDTGVKMADGTTKNIQDILVGEKVQGHGSVVNTVKFKTESVLGGRNTYIVNNVVESTGAHLYLAKDNKWKTPNIEEYSRQSLLHGERKHLEVTELKEGDILIINNKEELVESITINDSRAESEIVYDLIVDGNETYITENGYVSHSNIIHIEDYEEYNRKSRIIANQMKSE